MSAYESGRREPSFAHVVDLVSAAGWDVEVRMQRQPERLDVLSGPLGQRVRRHRRAVIEAVESGGLSNARLFGSVARGEDSADSDIDLLVDAPPGTGLVRLGRVQSALEDLLGAPVDLIPASLLEEDVRTNAERDLVPL